VAVSTLFSLMSCVSMLSEVLMVKAFFNLKPYFRHILKCYTWSLIVEYAFILLTVCNCLVQERARHVSPKSFVASCHVQAASHHLLCNKHEPWHRPREELVDGSRRVNQRRQLR